MNLSCDVLVVGAGVAGVPAAVAAARTGANTLLIEKRAMPGGAGVVGLHRTICGLYWNSSVERPGKSPLLLNEGGLVQEICERLKKLKPEMCPFRLGKVDVLPYATDQFQEVYRQLLAAEGRLCVMCNTEVKAVGLERGRISTVVAGDHVITPCVVVDASGDGVIIQSDPALHEAPPAGGRQLAGYVIQLVGLKEDDDMLPIKIPYTIRQGVEEGLLSSALRFTTFVSGDRRNEGWCKLSLPSGTKVLAAREMAEQLHVYLKSALPAMRASRISCQSSEVLEREGPRLKGLYTLTAEDILEAREFPDSVARSSWPIELWDPNLGPTYRYPEPGRACEIPLRCLKAVAVSNLYCAGRCISATHEALAATRVMGTCMALGEAAGRAAARSEN